MRVRSYTVAVVNTFDQFLARQRFTAAHELAHFLLDSPHLGLNIDISTLAAKGPIEQRANSFAIHLLLPATAVRHRFLMGTLNVEDAESLVSLAMEYGVSVQSMSWHIRNVLGRELERKQIAAVESPFRVATRLGLVDRVQQEFRAKGVTRWPRRYVRLALKGFEEGTISRERFQALIDDEALSIELERLLEVSP